MENTYDRKKYGISLNQGSSVTILQKIESLKEKKLKYNLFIKTRYLDCEPGRGLDKNYGEWTFGKTLFNEM